MSVVALVSEGTGTPGPTWSAPQAAADSVGRAGTLCLHGPQDARRAEVEAFIRSVYAQHYGADVQHFAPMLVSLSDASGELLAAVGYRPAADGPLFLERYLDRPVDEILAASHSSAPPRRGIVEVGHLAASRAGEGRRLIFLMGPHLAAQGFDWVVGTLTEELRHLFGRLGIAPLALGAADPAVLGEGAAQWGSYYQHHPLVLAGHLPVALRRLLRARR